MAEVMGWKRDAHIRKNPTDDVDCKDRCIVVEGDKSRNLHSH